MEKKYSLPADFGKKWVEALRSGEYEQGQHYLYTSHGCQYCCIGVAGIISGVPKEKMNGKNLFGTANNNDLVSYRVPKELRGRKKVREQLGGILSRMNDSGKTFSEIADWIEANIAFIPTNNTDPDTQSRILAATEHLKLEEE